MPLSAASAEVKLCGLPVSAGGDHGGCALVFALWAQSYRDVEELLAERGVEVDHVTVYRWVQRFTLLLVDAARPCRHAPGDRWCVDETYVKVAGRWVYLYRTIDQYGQVIDVLYPRSGIWQLLADSLPVPSPRAHTQSR